ncbi:hypothetical protein G7Y79_00020g049290 [Physcia stellaris]|nr:hypothetical protein G7Y79_00020g049290 [Physcia stellaris]
MEKNNPFFLSPFDNIQPQIYNPQLLLFPTPKDDADVAVQSFLHGLRSTFQAIPLLAGSIKGIPDGTAQVGTLAITSPWRTVDEIFKVKDLRKVKKYSYAALREQGYPPSSLPSWDFLCLSFYTDSNPRAMHVQITLIENGLVLAPCVHHSIADETGAATILQTWAAFCRGDAISTDKISGLWQPVNLLEGHEELSIKDFPDYVYREKTPLLSRRSYKNDESEAGWLSRLWLGSSLRKKLGMYLQPTLIKLAVAAFMKFQSLSHSTRLIYFAYADLARLKESLQAAREESDQTTWISTLDTMSMLLFCCVTQSRYVARRKYLSPSTSALQAQRRSLLTRLTGWLHHIATTRLLSPSASRSEGSAVFMTVVNVRKLCQLPPNYIRNITVPCNIRSPLHDLAPSTRNLATQARKLRTRLRAFDGTYVGRVASMIRSVPDVSKVGFSAAEEQRDGVFMTSWRDQNICDLDWGLQIGVKCERVRMGNMFHDGLIIVFPEYSGSKIDGGLELMLSLKKNTMRALESNEFFNQFAQWR